MLRRGATEQSLWWLNKSTELYVFYQPNRKNCLGPNLEDLLLALWKKHYSLKISSKNITFFSGANIWFDNVFTLCGI